MTHSVLLVGLGQIGMGYDLALDPSAFVLTHARAFREHEGFTLVGGVDPDPSRGSLFSARYGARSGTILGPVLRETTPEVVVVSSPTRTHGAVVHEVLAHAKPRIILCEKPLSLEMAEARAMVAACERHEVQLVVNYMRRAEPGALEVHRRIQDGRIQSPVKGVAWYTKGLFNNGSHFFNLLELWLGPVRSFTVIDAGQPWDGLDPQPDVRVHFAAGMVDFLAAREECFSHHEITLVAPNGCLRYEGGGSRIRWQPAVPDSNVPGYSVLSSVAEPIPTDSLRTQAHVVEQMAALLRGEHADLCSGAEALRSLEKLISISEAS